MGFEQLGCGDNSIANARGHLPCRKAWELKHGVMLAKPRSTVYAACLTRTPLTTRLVGDLIGSRTNCIDKRSDFRERWIMRKLPILAILFAFILFASTSLFSQSSNGTISG